MIISLSSQRASDDFSASRLADGRSLCAWGEAIPMMAWTANADGSVSCLNQHWSDFTGLDRAEDWMGALHPDDRPVMAGRWCESLGSRMGGERRCRVWSAQHQCFRWHLLRWQRIESEDGWAGVSIDIHDQKSLEERFEAEVTGRVADLQRLLSQKETLLQEVHHRVRNNLQIVASLLAMQMAALTDERLIAILRESERRIASMVLIHQSLYRSAQVARLDFSEYASTLVQELISMYGGGSQRIRGIVRAREVLLEVDQAIPCGLILNELVTNSLKYAYAGAETGNIFVDIEEMPDRFVVMAVRDFGRGLPKGFNSKEATSFGLTLVQELANQLGGELTIENRGGATFAVRFPTA